MAKRIFQPWSLVWATLALFGFLVLTLPEGASAAKVNPNDPGTYGAWGSPSQGGTGGITLAPYNAKHPEMVPTACVYNGSTLSDNQVRVLSEIAKMSLLVSRGQIDEEIWGGKKEDSDEASEDDKKLSEVWSSANSPEDVELLWTTDNYGFSKGTPGVQKFVKIEKRWLNKPLKDLPGTEPTLGNYVAEGAQGIAGAVSWAVDKGRSAADSIADTPIGGLGLAKVGQGAFLGADLGTSAYNNLVNDTLTGVQDPKVRATLSAWPNYSNRQFRASGSAIRVFMDAGNHRKKEDLEEAMEGFPLNIAESRMAASYLDSSKATPLNIFVDGFPDGCIVAVFNNNLDVSFSTLFENPDEFLVGITFGAGISMANGLYENIAADAWSGLMHTAHTERGDLIWDLDDKCLSSTEKSRGMFASTRYSDTCASNNTPLGFSKRNVSAKPKDRPFYLDLASLIAWLITGTYFVILFASAVVFIYRGNRSQNMNLMRVAPRILLAMMLAIAAHFLIGAGITFSNWISSLILEIGGERGPSINAMNTMLGAAGDMMNIESTTANAAVTLLVSGIAVVASLIFIFGVVIKQLFLIFLIVTAPIAIFCLLVDSWKPFFQKWIRGFLIILMIPIALALTLQIAVLLNPVMSDTVSDTLSGFMLVATLMAMAWIMKGGLALAIKGGGSGSLGAAALGQTGNAIQKVGGRIPVVGRGFNALGSSLSAAGAAAGAMGASRRMGGKLIPKGRAAGGGAEVAAIKEAFTSALVDTGVGEKPWKHAITRGKGQDGREQGGQKGTGLAKFGRRMDQMRAKRKGALPTQGDGTVKKTFADKLLSNSRVKQAAAAIGFGAAGTAGIAAGRSLLQRRMNRGNFAPDMMPTVGTEPHPILGSNNEPLLDEKGNPLMSEDTKRQLTPEEITYSTIDDKQSAARVKDSINQIDSSMRQRAAASAGFSDWSSYAAADQAGARQTEGAIAQKIWKEHGIVGGKEGITTDHNNITHIATANNNHTENYNSNYTENHINNSTQNSVQNKVRKGASDRPSAAQKGFGNIAPNKAPKSKNLFNDGTSP